MKINYVQHKDGTKLFSFYQHDFKEYNDGGSYIMIDGGFEGYTRYSGQLYESTIQDEIESIREQFTWGKNYDKDGKRLPRTITKLLKDLDTDHIYGIIRYFVENTEEMNDTIRSRYLIFLEELNYRQNVINK